MTRILPTIATAAVNRLGGRARASIVTVVAQGGRVVTPAFDLRPIP